MPVFLRPQARNILVCADLTLTVADFGLSRHIEIYQCSTNSILPIRWLSPEAMNEGLYSAKSDVWSFGSYLVRVTSMNNSSLFPSDSVLHRRRRDVGDLVQRIASVPGVLKRRCHGPRL